MFVHVDGDVWFDAAGYARHGCDKYLHRTVAEAALGRPLPNRAVVHHVDGDRKNNNPSNLVICPDQAYHKLLHQRQDCLDAGFDPNTHMRCSLCKTYHPAEEFAVNPATRRGRSNSCRKSFNEYRKAKGMNTGKWDDRARELQRARRVKAKAAMLLQQGGK